MNKLLTIFFFILSLKSFAVHYYFSSSIGDDTRSAIIAQNPNTPWQTIAKLNNFWNNLNAGDTVSFKCGDTFVGTINITKSGTNVNSIVLNSYSTGARPIITSLSTVSGFTNIGTNLWESAAIATGPTTIVNIATFDGVKTMMGRFPNVSAGNGGYRTYTAPTATTITDASLTGTWAQATVVIKLSDFEMNKGVISNQSGGGTLTFAGQSTHVGTLGFGYFIENSLATLDQQNEWFYNTSTKKLDVFSVGSPASVIKIATLTSLVTMTGARSFITFQNITFNGCNGRMFNLVGGASTIKWFNCDFLNAGTDCVFGSTTTNGQIINCNIQGTNNNIFIGSGINGWLFQDDTCRHNGADVGGVDATNNASFQGFRGFGNNITWLRVSIDTIGGHGINFQGNNISVKNCYVHNHAYLLSDVGGIYTWRGNADATVYTNRVIDGCIVNDASTNSQFGTAAASNSLLLTAGIYLDDFTQNVTVINCSAGNNPREFYGHNCFNTTPITAPNTGIIVNNNTFYNPTYGGIFWRSDAAPAGHVITGVNVTQNISVARTATTEAFRYHSISNDLNGVGRSDSNHYGRPFAETNFMQTEMPGSVLYTLPNFKTNFTIEQHTIGSPLTITTLSNLQYVFNATTVPVTVPLSGIWVDMKNVSYNSSITLPPFRSAILIFSGASTPPLSATVTALLNPVTCFNQVTQATVNVTGGTAPYQYEIGNAGFGGSNVFTGLGAGTYVFTVKDAALATTTVNLTITQPPQITISQSSPQITINGNTTTTTVTASGGTGTLMYSLDGSVFQSSNVFNNVGAGTHTITVRDANNCTNTLTYTLTQPSALVISAAATTNPLACFGNTTNATITASGGTTPYQYKLGNGAPQSSNVFTGLTANSYVFTVLDAGGASQSTTVTITQPTQISISESNTNIVVNGGSSTVTISASGGAGSFTYSLDGSAFQVSNQFTNVLAGNHTIVVRDANGCQNSLVFTITQPTLLTVSASVTTAIACNGGTGTVTVTASGGTTPYLYKVNSGTQSLQSSPVFSGLSAGTYTFTVQDNGGAIVSTQVTITQPAQINIATSFGSAPTTVTITASGGAGGFTYSLDGGTFQAGNSFANVGSGNHTVTVKDANGCQNSQSFSIGSSLTISVSVGVIACNGQTTSATVTPSGGTFPYTYSWSNGQQTSTATGLLAGTYTVTVTDNASHVHDTTFTIPQPTAINFSISAGTIIVNGGTTTVTVNGVSGGAGGYQYSLDGGAYQGSNSFAGVPAGNHTITVKDANSCTQTQNFSLSQPSALAIGITVGTAIACNGGVTTVTVSGSGGTTPYTYGENGVFQSGTLFSNVAAGTYTFSVRDAFNNQKDTIITIPQPPAIALSVTTGTIVVNGGTTTVTATASGGTGSLQYKLDAGSYQGTGNFAGVSAGTHTVTVKDANNCTQVNTFSISQPGILYITATPGANPFTCYGNTTTVTVVGSGGTTPFTYGKNGVFGGSGTFTNLVAGTYTFSVKDAFNAQHDTIITLSQPTLISLLQITQTTILTYGGTADITINNTGGTPTQDSLYSYALDGGGYTLSSLGFSYIFTSVTGGNHTVSIKDANGCIVTYPFFVIQPQAPLQFWRIPKPQGIIYKQI